MTIKERDIEKYLKTTVKAEGGFVRRVKWQGRHGAPDDVVFLWGVHFVECKAPGKEAEPHQKLEHARMLKQGVYVWVVDSYEAIDDFLRTIKNGC